MKRKISIIVHEIGQNPLGRAIPIIKAIKKIGFEVEILGFIIGGEDDIYTPYRQEVDVKALDTGLEPVEIFPKVLKIAKEASGDIIYAFKPLVTTFAPAYIAARVLENKPLILDVEDEEVYTDKIEGLADVWNKLVRGWNLATSWKYTRLLQLFRGDVDGVTVVSRALQEKYGGSLLRHGPDEKRFSPDQVLQDKKLIREKWGLPKNKRIAIFIGSPRSHKGLDTIARALCMPKCENWEFVLVGPENEFVDPLKKIIPGRVHFLGTQPYHHAPELLSLADAVPVPSKDTKFAQAQVPVKLLDAMAMARPVVASRIGDLPEILGNGERGWLIDPGSPSDLANALQTIGEEPSEAKRRGKNARRWYKENASTSATAKKLRDILEDATRGYYTS